MSNSSLNMTGEPEANFLKIILLLMKYGSMVLQRRIEYELRVREWQLVTQFLEKRKHDILHLTFDKHKICCIKDCKIPNSRKCFINYNLLKLMYIDMNKSCSTKFINCCSCNLVPRTDLDISVWDITLTSCLLLEIIGFKDAGQKQAILNLRNLRNSKELLHRGNAKMEDDEFEQMWIRLSNDIKEVAEKCEPYFFSSICEEVEKLKEYPLKQTESYKAQECWRELKLKNEEDSIQSVEKLLTAFKSEKKRDTEVENIYDYSNCCLKEHRENSSMYVEPRRAMNHSLKALEHHRLIVITGEAGSGKTRFGLELMSQVQNKHQSFTALILTKCIQWDILDFTKEYILFIDDLLGKSSADDGAFQSWSTAFDPMLKALNKGHVYLIFALRNNIWYLMKDKFFDYTLFRLLGSSNAPVDLSGVDFGMTSQEKLRMLKRFCTHYDVQVCKTLQEERMPFACSDDNSVCLSEETLKIIADMDTTSGFPFLCEQFFSQKKSIKKSSNFFKDYSARDFVKEQVDQLLFEKRYLQYVVLVYFVLKDKSFKVDCLLKVKKEIADIGLVKSTEIMPATMRGCLKDMLEKFISSSDGAYKLRHMVVYEAVLLSFGENFPEKFLELITKPVLFTYVRSKGYVAGDNEVIVKLDDDMTEFVAKKLRDVYGSNKEEAYSEVYKHSSFEDKKLVDCFLNILEGEESFKIFLKSFLAGACKERKDILASEVIRRFVSSDEFESEILDLILNNDLILSFRQYMNESVFEKVCFTLNFEISGVQLFNKAFTYRARQCIMYILNYLDTENDLETDCDKNSKMSMLTQICNDHLVDTLSHHDPSCGNDWTDVLTKLAKFCPSQEIRNKFYRTCNETSVFCDKIDYAFVLLKSNQSISYNEVKEIMRGIFLLERKDLIYTLCREMKRVHFKLNDLQSAELIMDCVHYNNNEDMFNVLLNEFPCNFYYDFDSENTILHVCEKENFSCSTILRVLRRSDEKNLFNLLNIERKTPVQCRTAYKKVRRDWRDDTLVMNSSFRDLHVHDVVWRDDTLISNSSYKKSHLQDDFRWRRPLLKFYGMDYPDFETTF